MTTLTVLAIFGLGVIAGMFLLLFLIFWLGSADERKADKHPWPGL